jgi:N-acetylglucosamine-6-phosphate deacetylase
MTLALTNARIVLPEGVVDSVALRVDGDRIVEVADRPALGDTALDLGGRWLVPGFVDTHVHGGGGESFQSGEAEAVRRAVAHHRLRGSTTVVASLVSRPVGEMVESVARLRELVTDGVVAGVHLEGPFLSEGRCGAHDPALLRDPDPELVRQLLDAGRGAVRMVTIAPERAGGIAAVRAVIAAGAVAAVGHTDATYAVAREAIGAGATVATHLFNAMAPLHHREPGPVLALLDDERVTVELIHDHEHLHPSVVRHVFAVAGGRTSLVSDAISAAGLSDGDYLLGGLGVVVRDGAARLAEGGVLAGSTVDVHRAFVNAVRDGIAIADAVASAASTPARALGLDHVGCLTPGFAADVLVLDDDLEIVAVMKDGGWLGDAPQRF